MKSLNPVCKLFGILIPTFILATIHHPILNLCVFLLCLIVMLFSSVSLKKLSLFMLPILLIAAGMFMTGYHFQIQGGAPVSAKSLNMTNSAVWNGLTLSSRVVAYAGLGFLFVLTTDKIHLVRSLEQQLRLPPLFAYGLLAAWNIFPNIMEEYQKTKATFRSRGLNPTPFSPDLLKPMLVKAVLWSEALSVAMESKGFNGSIRRTEYYKIKVSILDVIFPLLTTGGLLLAVSLLHL